jgi:hypothetical protein
VVGGRWKRTRISTIRVPCRDVVKDLILGTLAVVLGLTVVQSGGTSIVTVFGWVLAAAGLLLSVSALTVGRSRR